MNKEYQMNRLFFTLLLSVGVSCLSIVYAESILSKMQQINNEITSDNVQFNTKRLLALKKITRPDARSDLKMLWALLANPSDWEMQYLTLHLIEPYGMSLPYPKADKIDLQDMSNTISDAKIIVQSIGILKNMIPIMLEKEQVRHLENSAAEIKVRFAVKFIHKKQKIQILIFANPNGHRNSYDYSDYYVILKKDGIKKWSSVGLIDGNGMFRKYFYSYLNEILYEFK